MIADDVVPVSGAQFEGTLASASPDVLRAMIREFAERMMDADVEVACNAGCGEVTPDRVNSRNRYRRRVWGSITGSRLGGLAGWDHRWMIISVVYLLVCCLRGCLTALSRAQASKDAELMVLRYENAVLRRQAGRFRYQPGGRLRLAALSRLVPRRRQGEVFPVTPATLLAWHRRCRVSWSGSATRSRPPRCGRSGTTPGSISRPAAPARPPGSPGALLHRGPLRTAHATHHGTRPRQAAWAVQVVCCSTVFPASRDGCFVRWQVACTRCVRLLRAALGVSWWTR